jgi:hypothetical protein
MREGNTLDYKEDKDKNTAPRQPTSRGTSLPKSDFFKKHCAGITLIDNGAKAEAKMECRRLG